MNWRYFMVHHSLTEDGATVSWGAIRKYHLAKGWADIGYHFGVERAGLDYEAIVGRSLDMPGAHCKEGGMNGQAIGICLVGNFDWVEPSYDALSVMVNRLIIPLSRIYRIKLDAEHILFHREYATYKSCPGTLFSKDMVMKLINKQIV